ncbi:unnamed protein product [Peronospora belbahrii]|uniref:Type 1 phosphatases regulator n=1 Tax=Peronospora belbahrii TaxID=622444 RepID=A0AAU9KSL3_9STRA|nr:unnamed protein product [Peronospora belbahrii]CAH0515054.1 unnamed protein product [Peronospora belbahrii]
MNRRSAGEEARTEIVVTSLPPTTETAPVYRIQLHPRPRPHVTFEDSVVDNEHLGRKRSNKCCIFHKKREFGESSSESDEDSDNSDCDGEQYHQHDCKHTASHRRTRSKKPSPSLDEEKTSTPPQ